MDGVAGSGIVVWQPAPDGAASAGRWRRLIRWYSIPAVAAVVIALVLGGVRGLLVVAIALGAFAGVAALAVWAYDFNRRSGPGIRLVDGCLVFGGDAVRVDAVEAWTTHRRAAAPGAASVFAIFRIPGTDGDDHTLGADGPTFGLTRFAWAEMSERDFDELRSSLAGLIAAPWVPLERLSD